NTDAVGHMADGGGPFSAGKQTDNTLLLEFGGRIRSNYAPLDQFALAQATASTWRVQYDPDIHDLWKLAERFPDVYRDMTLYPKLFDPKFIAAYKAHGT